MVLKKPSEYFKKDIPSVDNSIQEVSKSSELDTFSDAFELFKKNLVKIDSLSDFSETIDNYRVNIERVNYLSEKVEDIQTEIQTLLKKEDLDRAIMTQLLIVEKSIQDVQNKVKGVNEKTLSEIRSNVSNLTSFVNEFLDVEVPKYKKVVVEYEIKTDSKIQEVKNIRDYALENLKTSNDIREDVINKVFNLHNEVVHNQSCIEDQNKTLEQIQEDVKSAIGRLNLDELEEKNHELSNKIKYLEEIFDKFNEKEILTENIVTEPPSTKNQDPLTPLDQNFVTLDQLQQHYRVFINRIQQQLATLGGGGETRLKYLDDIVGIATNASAYDGKFLKYNHSIQKFEFETVSGGGESYWVSTNAGIHTTSNVGIATTNPISQLSVGSFYGIDTTTTGITTTSATTIDSFSSTTFRSSRLQIQVTQGTDYQATDLLAIHNGSAVNIIEYGSIATNDYLGSFNGIVVGGNVIISITMNSDIAATVKVVSNRITL